MTALLVGFTANANAFSKIDLMYSMTNQCSDKYNNEYGGSSCKRCVEDCTDSLREIKSWGNEISPGFFKHQYEKCLRVYGMCQKTGY